MVKQIKRLFLSEKDKKIGGVCGGIAEYLDMDSTVIRVIAILLLIFTNVMAVIAYFLAWIVIPNKK
ncbi:PspC domain-containing protein [Candidatus Woesearchaeota archaeon]|nr:PspC domain-containing protein [Candidatus Woesearchaeota archaeon]